jgi:hypothetical protein
LTQALKQSRSFLDTLDPADPNAPAEYIRWHEANHADPIIGPALKAQGITVDQSRAKIQAAIARGPQAFADLINGSKLGTEKFMELNKPTTSTVDQGGQKQQTLTELARLQHQTAVRSAEAWNKRVKQLPKSATEGTGLSLEPIIVPPLSSAKSGGARPEGVGADWTLENDAAGNRAWVSPDRKSFKEVK